MIQKAIILVSGGIDSAVCLWWAKSKKWTIYALTFDYYPLFNSRDLDAAKALAKIIGVAQHRTLKLPFLKEFRDLVLPEDHPLTTEVAKISPSYIPARNLIFYGIAAHWAEGIGARWIVGGHNRNDFDHFPDSNMQYFKKLNELIREGSMIGIKQPVQIITPLSKLGKKDVIKLGMRLGVPLHLTWSCQARAEEPCGECLSCRQRREAFEALGLHDPAII